MTPFSIKEKLVHLGYDERDITRALNSFQMTVEKKELTDLGEHQRRLVHLQNG